MSEFVHVVRPNIFTTDRSFQMTDDAVTWEGGRSPGRLAFAEIERIRIHDAPMAYGPGLRRCVLRPRRGAKLFIPSLHYKRFGVTEDRSASYAPFVRELVARIARANPNVQIIAGRTRAAQAVWIVLLVSLVLVLALALVMLVSGQFPWQAIFMMPILIGFLPMTWRTARHPGPRVVDAHSIPPELLSD